MRVLTLNEHSLVAGGRSLQPNMMVGPGSGGYGGGGYSGGGYGGGGGGYGSAGGYIPPIDVTFAPIDIGGFDTTITVDDLQSGPLFVATINSDSVETPLMSQDLANTIGGAVQTLCAQKLSTNKISAITKALGCTAVSIGVSDLLMDVRVSNAERRGMQYNYYMH